MIGKYNKLKAEMTDAETDKSKKNVGNTINDRIIKYLEACIKRT